MRAFLATALVAAFAFTSVSPAQDKPAAAKPIRPNPLVLVIPSSLKASPLRTGNQPPRCTC